MKQITRLTDSAQQTFILIGENGEEINFALRYMPTQLSWFFDIDDGNSLTLKGAYLGVGANVLRNFRNNTPIGLAVISTDGFDPRDISDFTDGRVAIYLLNTEEVSLIEDGITNV